MLMVMIQTMEHAAAATHRRLDRLLVEVAGGDREAFGRLYEDTRAAVYAMALSVLKNADDARDVTQDTFVRIWESAPQYRPQGSPMAWILTVAKNLSRMRLRQHAHHAELEPSQWDAIPADAPAVTAEDRHLLGEALATLTDEERRIVMLHAVTGLKHRELADLLELPLPTVLSKYHRALKKLKAFMERR